MYYDLLDDHLKTIYLKTFNWMAIITLILLPILIAISFICIYVVILASVDAIILIYSIIKKTKNKNKYLKKIKIENNTLNLYSYKEKELTSLDLKSSQYSFISVGFFVPFRFVYKKCLVVYQSIDVYKEMKYSDCYDNKNIIVIQNKKAINEVFKVLVN